MEHYTSYYWNAGPGLARVFRRRVVFGGRRSSEERGLKGLMEGRIFPKKISKKIPFRP